MVKFSRKLHVSSLWVTSHERVSDFYASSWQPGESAIPMLVFHLVLASLAVAVLAWSVWESPSPYWMLYLTNWGVLMLAAMTLSGVFVSSMAVFKRDVYEGEALPWYMSLYWLLYNCSVSIAFLITALYWILLYDPESSQLTESRVFWLDVTTHAFNSGVALAEVLASRTPVRLLHIYQPLALGLWYGAFSWIFYLAGGTDINGFPYIYEVLDWRQGIRSAAIVAVSSVGLISIYVCLWGVALCRDRISAALVRTTSHDLPYTPSDSDMRAIV